MAGTSEVLLSEAVYPAIAEQFVPSERRSLTSRGKAAAVTVYAMHPTPCLAQGRSVWPWQWPAWRTVESPVRNHASARLKPA